MHLQSPNDPLSQVFLTRTQERSTYASYQLDP
jgi:hypothetical protein